MDRDCAYVKNNYRFRYRAAAVIIEENSLLVITNEKVDYYYSVGGGVHLGERAEDAVKREVFEETGMEYEVDRLLFVNENFFTDDVLGEVLPCHEIAMYFLMKPKGSRKLPENISYCICGKEELKWIELDKLGECNLLPGFLKDEIIKLTSDEGADGVKHVVTID